MQLANIMIMLVFMMVIMSSKEFLPLAKSKPHIYGCISMTNFEILATQPHPHQTHHPTAPRIHSQLAQNIHCPRK